jgi:hypothetical protein
MLRCVGIQFLKGPARTLSCETYRPILTTTILINQNIVCNKNYCQAAIVTIPHNKLQYNNIKEQQIMHLYNTTLPKQFNKKTL